MTWHFIDHANTIKVNGELAIHLHLPSKVNNIDKELTNAR
jgi:hypothetical protein